MLITDIIMKLHSGQAAMKDVYTKVEYEPLPFGDKNI